MKRKFEIWSVITWILLALFGLFLARPFIRSQTQVESIRSYGDAYLRIVTIGSVQEVKPHPDMLSQNPVILIRMLSKLPVDLLWVSPGSRTMLLAETIVFPRGEIDGKSQYICQ